MGSNLLCFFNLFLVALDLSLKLVNQGLHTLMILLVLIRSKSQLLNGAFRLAKILADISIASVFSIKLRFQLSNAGFHLNHGLASSLQCIDFSFKLPLSGGNGLVDVSKIRKSLICVSKLL